MLPNEEAEISDLYGETDGVKTGVLASQILILSFGPSASSVCVCGGGGYECVYTQE